MSNSEKWRPVVGFEGKYEVSSQGIVRGLDREVPHYRGGVSMLQGRVLKPDTSGYYHRVTLASGGNLFRKSVHRLVCEAFNGPPPIGKPWALHRDGDSRNNTPQNLYWGTPKENMADKKAHGRNHELNKTHCTQGHPYSGENLYIVPRSGKRQCRKCGARRSLENRDKNNAARREKRKGTR